MIGINTDKLASGRRHTVSNDEMLKKRREAKESKYRGENTNGEKIEPKSEGNGTDRIKI